MMQLHTRIEIRKPGAFREIVSVLTIQCGAGFRTKTIAYGPWKLTETGYQHSATLAQALINHANAVAVHSASPSETTGASHELEAIAA